MTTLTRGWMRLLAGLSDTAPDPEVERAALRVIGQCGHLLAAIGRAQR